jgi:hypothetical protein
VTGLHVVERPAVLIAGQVAEWVARVRAGVDAAAVRLVMRLVLPVTFLTER